MIFLECVSKCFRCICGSSLSLSLSLCHPAPSGSPQSLRIVSTTPTGITVEWSDINCLKQNGAITTYDVRVNGIVVLTTSQTQATITGLTSSTAYFIDVRGNNSIGGGPFSPTSMFVTAGVIVWLIQPQKQPLTFFHCNNFY